MTMNEETIATCHDLAAGDLIAARYQGTPVHRGCVTERVPDHGLFWIMDPCLEESRDSTPAGSKRQETVQE